MATLRCPPATGKIAVLERELCSYTEMVADVEAAVGHENVIVIIARFPTPRRS